MLTFDIFRKWLENYREAWESHDPGFAAALFTEDSEYYWTPFENPKRGRDEIARAWEQETSRQQDIHFEYTVLAVNGPVGIAHWHTSFIRMATGKHVELDGIIMAEFDENNKCSIFREWWHSSE